MAGEQFGKEILCRLGPRRTRKVPIEDLLNDHDLRALTECSADIRHCEGLAMGLLGVAVAALVAGVVGFTAASGQHFLFSLYVTSFLLPYALGFVLLAFVTLAERRANAAGRKMLRIYDTLAKRNGLSPNDFATFCDVSEQKDRIKRENSLSMGVWWMGAILLFVALLASVLFEFVRSFEGCLKCVSAMTATPMSG